MITTSIIISRSRPNLCDVSSTWNKAQTLMLNSKIWPSHLFRSFHEAFAVVGVSASVATRLNSLMASAATAIKGSAGLDVARRLLSRLTSLVLLGSVLTVLSVSILIKIMHLMGLKSPRLANSTALHAISPACLGRKC